MRIHPSILDVIFVLVIFYVSSTVILVTYAGAGSEVQLPAIDLAETSRRDSGMGDSHLKAITITIERDESGHRYYLDQDAVSLEQLEDRLTRARPRRVDLRVGREVLHLAESHVFDICLRAGIGEVSFVALAESEGEKS